MKLVESVCWLSIGPLFPYSFRSKNNRLIVVVVVVVVVVAAVEVAAAVAGLPSKQLPIERDRSK
jgi:hypothetical protein